MEIFRCVTNVFESATGFSIRIHIDIFDFSLVDVNCAFDIRINQTASADTVTLFVKNT